ncbi:hypothetical protein THAOC_19302 [Thalassiosira oceanica]|uniref:Uncharacterized protein n=1 Tax=Thalassiosira oceanica TaxID=159749 RepID=K0S2P0_THAOC|nr:hypothetical protein THAOC_19302 [Thalassiosira oceanica]|eukprot:EJK60358.1 hypothetical protein THAOC_19302 [Thalassiosira oceanica]
MPPNWYASLETARDNTNLLMDPADLVANVSRSRRANKRRARYDLPGPAGTWFKRQKQKKTTKLGQVNPSQTKEEDSQQSSGAAVRVKHLEDVETTPVKGPDEKQKQLFQDYR